MVSGSAAEQRMVGKVVIVTGAGRGLGRHIAHTFAAEGARVAVVDLNLRSYRDFAGEARAMTADTTDAELRLLGHDSQGYEVDLTDRERVFDVFAKVVSDFGGTVDALICNAGGGSGDLHGNRAGDLDTSMLEAALQRNLFTTVNSCTAIVPFMRRAGHGSIVTISSINGLGPMPDGAYSHYGVSKAAVIMYTKYLANDVGPSGIRVNVLAPGTLPTGRISELWEATPDAARDLDSIALRRRPELAEVSNVVMFLASDQSSYLTGQVLTVDGGRPH